MQSCNVDLHSAELLRDALLANGTIKSLECVLLCPFLVDVMIPSSLNDNNLGKYGAAAVADVLRSTRTITHLKCDTSFACCRHHTPKREQQSAEGRWARQLACWSARQPHRHAPLVSLLAPRPPR